LGSSSVIFHRTEVQPTNKIHPAHRKSAKYYTCSISSSFKIQAFGSFARLWNWKEKSFQTLSCSFRFIGKFRQQKVWKCRGSLRTISPLSQSECFRIRFCSSPKQLYGQCRLNISSRGSISHKHELKRSESRSHKNFSNDAATS
jgi:hypothetical protein